MHISSVCLLSLLGLALAIPGKSNVYYIVDSPESEEWSWLARLSDRYRFNAEAQRILHDRLVMNYMRPIPKAPKVISDQDPITVLVWNPEGLESVAADKELISTCPVPCRVTTDRSESESAHIVMTTGEEVPEVFSLMQPHQQKALFVLEPDLSLPSTERRIGPFHMLVSYSRHSDVKIEYTRSILIPEGLPDLTKKTKKALAAAFISNCDKNGDARYRLDYLKELSVHMDVDSYGSCHHTPGLPNNVKDIKEIADQYHYILVFENSILDDYVTDKFYDSLGTDAIPVYLGAPNVAEYLPDAVNNRIVIEARNYPDPTSLASYLKELAQDEKSYMEFFEWRSAAIDSTFSKQYDFEQTGKNSFICRMCEHYNMRAEK